MATFLKQARRPRLVMAVVRALLVTFLVTLLSFAVSLMLAIGGLLIAAAGKGATVDMTFGYRHIAVPVAIVVAPIVLLLSLIMEIRHYRQAKTLASIKRAG